MNHEVLDCPRMITKIEEMDIRQENPKADPETEITTEPQKVSEKLLLQMKVTLMTIDISAYQRSSKKKNALK